MIYFAERPSFKTILKAILIGCIEMVVGLLFILGIYSIYLSVKDYFLWTDLILNPFFGGRTARMLALFLLVEEGARYLIVKIFIEKGKIKLKSPLQAVLIFLIIGSISTFATDIIFMSLKLPVLFTIAYSLSKNLIYALIYSHYFSKYIIQLKAKDIMSEYDTELKRNLGCSNIYTIKQRHLLKGFGLNISVRLAHIIMVVLIVLLNVFGFVLFMIYASVLIIIFAVRISGMRNLDVPYDTLAKERIYNDFPALYNYFERENKNKK